MTADLAQFRQLLSRFATGVTVATTVDGHGRPVGMTASAVSAVSLEPPLLLVCVSHAADFHEALATADAFALNVLANDQEPLSRTFAEKGTDRFAELDYDMGPNGQPLISGVTAHIFCSKWGQRTVGDHTIFFGQVVGGAVFDRPPLVHYRSRYTTLADE